MPNKRFPAIPDPGSSVESLREAVVALKQIVEALARQRDPGGSAVTWDDLVALEIFGVDSHSIPDRGS